MDVLNPSLYRRLKRHFGSVKVSSHREKFDAIPARDIHSDEEKPKLLIKNAGEYYQVCCPYCSDTKHRLYINHMYGKRDDFGRKMTFLAICYNETACMSKADNQADLYDTLSEIDGVLERARIKEGVDVPQEAREFKLPGPCVRLDSLKPDHIARLYLESRNFDPDVIARRYGVSFCLDSHYFLARERLIIPIYERGKLKGWQARYVGELAWKKKSYKGPPKYFSCPGMDRRMLLYNLDNAREYNTGVIVEGPTDVWSFGPMAVCTFGATMTEFQKRKFMAVFRKRTAVLVYDPEEFEEPHTQRLIDYFKRRFGSGQFAAVKLPDGTDPGSLDRAFLRDFVAGEAEKQGVIVSWKKVR